MGRHKTQTAVTWLWDCIPNELRKDEYIKSIFETAERIEKEHIKITYSSRCSYFSCENKEKENCSCGENFYKEHFKTLINGSE